MEYKLPLQEGQIFIHKSSESSAMSPIYCFGRDRNSALQNKYMAEFIGLSVKEYTATAAKYSGKVRSYKVYYEANMPTKFTEVYFTDINNAVACAKELSDIWLQSRAHVC